MICTRTGCRQAEIHNDRSWHSSTILSDYRVSSVGSGSTVDGRRADDCSRAHALRPPPGPSRLGQLIRHLADFRGAPPRSLEIIYIQRIELSQNRRAKRLQGSTQRVALHFPGSQLHPRPLRLIATQGTPWTSSTPSSHTIMSWPNSTKRSPRWVVWWSACWRKASTRWKSAIRSSPRPPPPATATS